MQTIYRPVSTQAQTVAALNRPLKPREGAVPRNRISNFVFKLWRDYFAFEEYIEDPAELARHVKEGKTFLVGQAPHAIVVRCSSDSVRESTSYTTS